MNIALICLLVIILISLILLIVIVVKKNISNNDRQSTGDLYIKIGNIESAIHNQNEKNKIVISETTNEQYEKLSNKLETQSSNISEKIDKNFGAIKEELSSTLDRELELLKTSQNNLRDNIDILKSTVNSSIETGFQTNNNQVKEVIKSLENLKSASLNLQEISKDIQSLNESLNFSKPSGKFGEQALDAVLCSVFGETKNIYELQYVLINDNDESKRVIADAVIHLPSPINLLCIDSKFSFIKFKALFNNKDENNTKALKTEFRNALRQQINKIATSYIINNKTANYAIMFIPNDGIFVYLQTDDELYEQVIKYGYNKKVILTSPATLQPILANMNLFKIKQDTISNISNILKQIENAKKALANYQESWKSFSDAIDALSKKRDDFSKKVNTLDQKLTNCLKNGETTTILELKDEESIEKN